MKFYYQNVSSYTITYTGTEDTGYPVENLNNVNKNPLFKDSSPVDALYVKIDAGASLAADSIVLGNYVCKGAITAVYGSIDDSTYTLIGSISASSVEIDTILTFSSRSYRYWKLLFFEIDSFTEIQIGNVFLGNSLELSHNPELNYSKTSGYGGIVNISDTGFKTSKIKQDKLRESFVFDYQYANPSDEDGLETLRDTILMDEKGGESFYPFFYEFRGEYYFARWMGPLDMINQAYQAKRLTINLVGEL